jgi:DNA-directed RNA polymerase sigma subunit (sigma70/sigma32)
MRLSSDQIEALVRRLKACPTDWASYKPKYQFFPVKRQALLDDIGSIEQSAGVPAQELSRLVCVIQAGENVVRTAMKNFTEANLRLVVSIAKLHESGPGLLGFDSGRQPGLRAPSTNLITVWASFSTYASWWIRQGITRGLIDTGRTIRVPVHRVEVQQSAPTAQHLQRQLGRDPRPEELAKEMGVSVAELFKITHPGGANRCKRQFGKTATI